MILKKYRWVNPRTKVSLNSLVKIIKIPKIKFNKNLKKMLNLIRNSRETKIQRFNRNIIKDKIKIFIKTFKLYQSKSKKCIIWHFRILWLNLKIATINCSKLMRCQFLRPQRKNSKSLSVISKNYFISKKLIYMDV